MGRLISDILTKSGLVGYLAEAGQSEILKATNGKTLDGRSLFRLKLVEELQTEPDVMTNESVRNKRIPVEDFPLFTAKESVECLLAFIASCLADGTPLHVDLLERASQPATEVIMRKRRRKRIISEEEAPQRKKTKAVKKKGISLSETLVNETDSMPPTSSHVPSEQHNQTLSEPHHQKNISEQSLSEQQPNPPENPQQ